MVDLTDICGDDAQIASLQRKREKAVARLDALSEKAFPIVADIAMFDEMIAAILKRRAAGKYDGDPA